jgi:hypothetical protein
LLKISSAHSLIQLTSIYQKFGGQFDRHARKWPSAAAFRTFR